MSIAALVAICLKAHGWIPCLDLHQRAKTGIDQGAPCPSSESRRNIAIDLLQPAYEGWGEKRHRIHPTPAGGQWHAVTVKRVLERLTSHDDLVDDFYRPLALAPCRALSLQADLPH